MCNTRAIIVTAVLSFGLSISAQAEKYVSNDSIWIKLNSVVGPIVADPEPNAGKQSILLESSQAVEIKLDTVVKNIRAVDISDLIIYCEQGYGLAQDGGLGKLFSLSPLARAAELSRMLRVGQTEASLLLPYLNRTMSFDQFKQALIDAEIEQQALKGIYYELIANPSGMSVARTLGFLSDNVDADGTEVCLAQYDSDVQKRVSKVEYINRYDHSAFVKFSLDLEGVTLTETEKEQLSANIFYKNGFQIDLSNRGASSYHKFLLSNVKVKSNRHHNDENVLITGKVKAERIHTTPANNVQATAYFEDGELYVELVDPATQSEMRNLIGEAEVEFGVYRERDFGLFNAGFKTLYETSIRVAINSNNGVVVINTGLTKDKIGSDEIWIEWTINRKGSSLYKYDSVENDSKMFEPVTRN